MNRLPPKRASRCRPLLAVLVASMLAHTGAHACTSAHAGALTSIGIEAWDDTAADVVISPWRHTGNANYLLGCSSSQVIPMTATAAFSTLEFVRTVTVDGERYPAFGVRGYPRSPLLVFRYSVGNGSGSRATLPLDVRTPARFSGAGLAGTSRWAFVSVAAVSRGGIMQPLPSPISGAITYAAPLFPALTKRDTYQVTTQLKTKTCTFTHTRVTLRDVVAAELLAPGNTAGDQDFNVVMNCNGVFPLSLALTDANEPANTGSRLAPGRNATAAAVRMQLLREGVPVVLGQRWTVAQSQQGNQNVVLRARYYRKPGILVGGVVEGQAIITATYR